MSRYETAGGEFLACSICVNAKGLDPEAFIGNARVGGTVQLWEWIDEGTATFSF